MGNLHVRINLSLLHNPWVKEITKEVRKQYFELNENKNTKYKNLWDAAKAVFRNF